jgi:hypothetical protein
MLEPHQRAALIPNEPHVHWHSFLRGRFIGSLPERNKTLAIALQAVEQQSPVHAAMRGWVELSSGGALPVVSEFAGVLSLETREVSLRQTQPDKEYTGQISENGRVMVLRVSGQAKPIHLVHEETLAELL